RIHRTGIVEIGRVVEDQEVLAAVAIETEHGTQSGRVDVKRIVDGAPVHHDITDSEKEDIGREDLVTARGADDIGPAEAAVRYVVLDLVSRIESARGCIIHHQAGVAVALDVDGAGETIHLLGHGTQVHNIAAAAQIDG